MDGSTLVVRKKHFIHGLSENVSFVTGVGSSNCQLPPHPRNLCMVEKTCAGVIWSVKCLPHKHGDQSSILGPRWNAGYGGICV